MRSTCRITTLRTTKLGKLIGGRNGFHDGDDWGQPRRVLRDREHLAADLADDTPRPRPTVTPYRVYLVGVTRITLYAWGTTAGSR